MRMRNLIKKIVGILIAVVVIGPHLPCMVWIYLAETWEEKHPIKNQ